MSDKIENEFVTVGKEYLKELEKSAQNDEYQRGYIQGLDEGIDYAERLIRAMRTKGANDERHDI